MRARLAVVLLLPFTLLISEAGPVTSGGAGRAFEGDLPALLAGESSGGATALPFFSGEPNLAVGADGTVFVSGFASSGTRVFRMRSGESSFTDLGVPDSPFGGGDEAIATGPDGSVFISGMYWGGPGWCASVTRSRDNGATWDPTVAGLCAGNRIDRQWIAVDGDGNPWMIHHEPCCAGDHAAYRSSDGGVTWRSGGAVTAIGGFPGNLFVDRARGIVYEATACDLGVCLFSTQTSLESPVWRLVTAIPVPYPDSGLKHLTGAVDDAGNLYLAWMARLVPTETSQGIYVARSTTGGATWTVPERVNGPGLGVFPWIVAGADGKVALVWYGAVRGLDANVVPANTEWNVQAAWRTDWSSGTWTRAQVSTTPNHVGVLCTNGAACWQQGLDRDLLDFFEAAVAPDGTVHVAWSDDVAWRVKYATLPGVDLR